MRDHDEESFLWLKMLSIAHEPVNSPCSNILITLNEDETA